MTSAEGPDAWEVCGVGAGRWRGSEGHGGFPLRKKDARDVEKVGRIPVEGADGIPTV